jgi:hypothetical protein
MKQTPSDVIRRLYGSEINAGVWVRRLPWPR